HPIPPLFPYTTLFRSHKLKTDVLLDQPQQMVLGNLIFQAEVVEQRFRAVVLPHHDQQASDDRNQTEHGRMLSSNMLLRNLILLIDVTFSTPTAVLDSCVFMPTKIQHHRGVSLLVSSPARAWYPVFDGLTITPPLC